uniref:putative uncharacterized protein DDB_G0282129 n=1 Tax=Ciona intestinalis TaxID=7719 RepID=UPI000EF4D3DC
MPLTPPWETPSTEQTTSYVPYTSNILEVLSLLRNEIHMLVDKPNSSASDIQRASSLMTLLHQTQSGYLATLNHPPMTQFGNMAAVPNQYQPMSSSQQQQQQQSPQDHPQMTQFGNKQASSFNSYHTMPLTQQQDTQSYAEAVQTTSNRSVTIENECVSQGCDNIPIVPRKNNNVGNTSSTKPESKQEQKQGTGGGKRRDQPGGSGASADQKKQKSDKKQGKGEKGGENNQNKAVKQSQNKDQKATKNEGATSDGGSGENKNVSNQSNQTTNKKSADKTDKQATSGERNIKVTSDGKWDKTGEDNSQERIGSDKKVNESKKGTLVKEKAGKKSYTDSVGTHDYDLRSRNNGGNDKQESKPDLVACFNYCQATETPLATEENEQVVEFRVLVDKKDKIPEGRELNVYIDGKGFHRMHPDTYIKTG